MFNSKKQLVLRHTSSYKSVIFHSLSKTSMSETSSTNKTCFRFQIIYNKYSYPSTTFQKPGVFHPQPTPQKNPPPAASPDPGVLNELPPTEWPGDDRRFGSWEVFFWEGEKSQDVQGDCCFWNVHCCETFQILRCH